ncbi:MAG: DUF1616 domain-containing protein [Dehalococcoidales bacterium]|nr:MAG: DUF1616 domain-containing protein [Dehalococcoidales bacterium]
MSVKLKDELIALNLLSILLFLSILFLPDSSLRIIPGIPFVLFLPGYSLIAALYPRKTDISGTERILWSIGLSIAIVPLIGLCLNLIPPGIRLIPGVISIASFTFIMSTVAWYRRRNLLEYERFSVSFTLGSPLRWSEQTVLDRVLFVGLILAFLFAAGVIGYKMTAPVSEERITEFYILNTEGSASDYPEQLKIGEEQKVIIGITNSEHDEMTYRLEMKVDGVLNSTISGITLKHGETKQTEIVFSFSHAGDNQKVEFVLYRGDETGSLVTPLYLWIDVFE